MDQAVLRLAGPSQRAAIRTASAKIARLASGGTPRLLDLFAGCGGLSLGFQAAGCSIDAAVEIDSNAAQTHGLNFHNGAAKHSKSRNIEIETPESLAADLGLGSVSAAFDIIVGGPPCQAFARVGRSKLREVADHPEAFRHDPRARLYIHYLDFVAICAPLAVVIENVPDMLNHGGHNIAEEIAEVLTARGYTCRYTLLNAAFYGVPQMRERMFLVALRRELKTDPVFPTPTHWIDLPSGYESSRSVALKLLGPMIRDGRGIHYRDAPVASSDKPNAVTAADAIGDLPKLHARTLRAEGKLRRGVHRFKSGIPYEETSPVNDYVKLMRGWPNIEAPLDVTDHVIRFLPRDYDLFARLHPGDQYPEAHKLAQAMFAEALQCYDSAQRPSRNSSAWKSLRDSIVPPYDPSKFPNKWRKMEADRPARTLLAHLGKDSYSHIHYDSDQARTISVREAARLQSFPDGFKFAGTMNPAFRQIGNAVPPLLARRLAESILRSMSVSRKSILATGGRR